MKERIQNILIPLRFMSTVWHLWMLCILQFAKIDLENAKLSSNETIADTTLKSHSLTGMSFLGFLCLLLDFSSIWWGFSLFDTMVNIIQIACHLLGAVSISLALSYDWTIASMWYIWLGCSFPPALAELWGLCRLFVLRTTRY